MSAITILELVVLALILGVAVLATYTTSKLLKSHQEFTLLLKRVESDAQALQKIALEIESGIAAVGQTFTAAMAGAAERQAVAMDSLRDYMEVQEQKLDALIESLSDSVRGTIPSPREPRLDGNHDQINLSRLRKESLRNNPELRFSVLKEWFSVNVLGILHRASRGWSNVNELIANVPVYLEPQAELLDDTILLIGTRGHAEKLAISLQKVDSSSNYGHWFEPVIARTPSTYTPAVVIRSGTQQFDLVSKGTTASSLTN